MQLENTLFIIKPDGILKKEEIIKRVNSEFNVIFTIPFRYNLSLIKEFYPNDINQKYFPGLIELLQEDFSELNIVSGYNAVQRFYEFTGTKTIPIDCEKESLRYQFGEGCSLTKSGIPIIKNVIHRCKSKEEYNFNLELLSRHLRNSYLLSFKD